MKEWIELSDGTKVQDAYVVKLGDDNIAIYMAGGRSFIDLYALFGSAEKTAHMVSNQYGDVAEWDGFTVLTSIQVDVGGSSVVCLTK